MSQTIRKRLLSALDGEPVIQPVYAVYDWFVQNRRIDWTRLFDRGLGQINHVVMADVKRPNVEIHESSSRVGDAIRKDVRWVTDVGELHEWYLGEWRQEHLVKTPDDYRILQHALEGSNFTLNTQAFAASEAALGDAGMTLGHLWRTPLQEIQIDYVGLEEFSFHLADEEPELLELLEYMTFLKCEEARVAASHPAKFIKLWENLSIQTMGPANYRKFILPVYDALLAIFQPLGKRIMVHYDGSLKEIASDFARYPIDIDSVTPPPEGNMTIPECRAAWPDKFFWLHPSLSCFQMPEQQMLNYIAEMIRDAGPQRYCLMISEDVPPEWEWRVPKILEMLEQQR